MQIILCGVRRMGWRDLWSRLRLLGSANVEAVGYTSQLSGYYTASTVRPACPDGYQLSASDVVRGLEFRQNN